MLLGMKSICEFKVRLIFNDLLKHTNKFPDKVEIDDITLVNCILFQNRLCQQISAKNITLQGANVTLAMGGKVL